MSETPEAIVQRQVDAYNAHDLDAFMATYQSDAAYIRHPSGEVVMAGRADIRQAFGDLFAAHPRVHVDITNRMVLGRLVVDAERITGRADVAELRLIAIYEVQNNLIHRVWPLRG